MKTGERTRLRIMETGCRMWLLDPASVTCRAIARALDINHATILYHYETRRALQNALAEYAVQNGVAGIVAQLIATNHPATSRLTASERERYLLTLTN